MAQNRYVTVCWVFAIFIFSDMEKWLSKKSRPSEWKYTNFLLILRQVSLHVLLVELAAFSVQAVYLWELVLKSPHLFLPPEPGIKQDTTCSLKLSLFWQSGFLPISFADLEMKKKKKKHGLKPLEGWQSCVPSSWSLMLLCLSLNVNLFPFT